VRTNMGFLNHWHHHRSSMGQFSLGQLLVLGSKRNMVVDHMVDLCHLASRQIRTGLEWQTGCLAFHYRIHGGDVYLFRCQPAAGITQLRRRLIARYHIL